MSKAPEPVMEEKEAGFKLDGSVSVKSFLESFKDYEGDGWFLSKVKGGENHFVVLICKHTTK